MVIIRYRWWINNRADVWQYEGPMNDIEAQPFINWLREVNNPRWFLESEIIALQSDLLNTFRELHPEVTGG